MKKILLLSAAVLSILAAVSCAKEEQETVDRVAKTKHRTVLSATLPSPKTALGDLTAGVWPNYWKTDDQIIVNGVTSEYLEAQYDGQDTATFTFDELLTQPYYAAYPVSAVSDYNEGTATVTLPAVQSYVEGSYDPEAFILCGQNSGSALSLDPKVSIIHLSFTGNASICRIKLTGGSGTALSGTFSTDFVDLTPVSASNVVELKASDAIQLPADFFITVPVGLVGALNVAAYDTDGGKMSKNATVKSALTAGQVYSPAALAYTPSYAIEATAEGITSSTAIICWDNCGDAGHCPAYTVSVYSDAGCASLVDSYAVPAGASCWGGETPRFCVSGLDAGTTYYVKVTNETKGAESNIVSVTTADFNIVQVSDDPADVDEVILAEDFGELRWDCDVIGGGVGFFATSQDSFDNTEVLSYQAAATANEKALGSQTSALALSRLTHWAQGANNNLYIHPGYIKLVGSKKETHLVTPKLNSIPDGMVATVEVEVTASGYFSASDNRYATTKAMVAVQSGDCNELVAGGTNTLDLTSNVANITLPEETAWNTFKVTLNGVAHGDRLAFGARSDVTKNDARMNISDMKVTIKALYDPDGVTASVKSVSSSTASFTWTHAGSASQDVAKPYTIYLYRNAECDDLLVSHSFEANASCWDKRIPCFVIGGLQPSTTYWFIAEDTESGATSEAVSVTTEDFTPVDATMVSNANVGDVILAEDFSEIGWGPDEFAVAAGFIPSPKTLDTPSGTSPEGIFTTYNNTGQRIFGTGVELGDSRLSKGWGFFGNSAAYLRNAYLRVATTTGRTHIVTPALSGIPAGKVATIDVTITATKHESNENDVAVFVSDKCEMYGVTDPDNSSFHKYKIDGSDTKLPKHGTAFGITSVREWQTKSVSVHNVDSGCQLIIGSLEDISGVNRFSITDVKVTIQSLKDPGEIEEIIDINDFDSFKDFLISSALGVTVQANINTDLTLTSEQLDEIDGLYPIEYFDGVVNGNNHSIAGLTKPLFGDFMGTVSNLTLNSSLNITDAQNSIGILAESATNAVLTGCTTTGSVTFNCDSKVTGSIALGGMVGDMSGCTLTNCQNQATVENSTGASVGIFIGGLAGESASSTFVSCSNTADVSNTGLAEDFSGYPCDVNIGGLVGYLHGVNTLTGTSTEYNYNSGDVSELSTSTYVGLGGIAGSSAGAGTDMAYAHNSGEISYKNNTRYNSYVGGIVGCAQEIFTMDYADNSGNLVFRALTISHQVWVGGILGGFNASNSTTKSASLTVTGCHNSGKIDCPNSSSGANMAAASSSVTSFSYMGGICGVGDCGSKEFLDCTNTGHIAVYNQLKMRLGGIVGYTTSNPTGCVNTGPVNYCRYKGPGNSGASVVGGIVGYTGIATPHDLTNDATVRTTGSSPASLCGGIAGQVGNSTTGFENCNVGSSSGSQKTISGASEGNFAKSNAAGLFTSVSSKRAWDFTGCKIKNGTKCQAIEVTSENLNSALIGHNNPPTSVTNPPIFVDSF